MLVPWRVCVHEARVAKNHCRNLAGFQKPDPMDFVRTATATQALDVRRAATTVKLPGK